MVFDRGNRGINSLSLTALLLAAAAATVVGGWIAESEMF